MDSMKNEDQLYLATYYLAYSEYSIKISYNY